MNGTMCKSLELVTSKNKCHGNLHEENGTPSNDILKKLSVTLHIQSKICFLISRHTPKIKKKKKIMSSTTITSLHTE